MVWWHHTTTSTTATITTITVATTTTTTTTTTPYGLHVILTTRSTQHSYGVRIDAAELRHFIMTEVSISSETQALSFVFFVEPQLTSAHSSSFSSGKHSSVLRKATTTCHSTIPILFLAILAGDPRTATSARNLLCPKCARTLSQFSHCILVNEEQDAHPSD